MKRASSSGVLVHGEMARPFILSCVSGRLMKAVSTPLSLSMIGRGVPAGAATENQGGRADPRPTDAAERGRAGHDVGGPGDATAIGETLRPLVDHLENNT